MSSTSHSFSVSESWWFVNAWTIRFFLCVKICRFGEERRSQPLCHLRIRRWRSLERLRQSCCVLSFCCCGRLRLLSLMSIWFVDFFRFPRSQQYSQNAMCHVVFLSKFPGSYRKDVYGSPSGLQKASCPFKKRNCVGKHMLQICPWVTWFLSFPLFPHFGKLFNPKTSKAWLVLTWYFKSGMNVEDKAHLQTCLRSLKPGRTALIEIERTEGISASPIWSLPTSHRRRVEDCSPFRVRRFPKNQSNKK